MPQVQTVEATSDPTLSKLLEADATLVAQAATLTAQLEAIEEKRQGLQTVIELFSSIDSPSVDATTYSRQAIRFCIPCTLSSRPINCSF
ncbi:hypothetical protein H6F95_24440 [Cyanobacteria bacterium FACHB-471]|nr:hypothetical protein [Cyanobacteria bacterium FACHB-471]